MLLSRILSYLNPTRLLLHTASLVCHTWRRAAAPLLADHVSRAILAELGSGSSSSSSDQLSIDLVQRTPLLAYYGETIADAKRNHSQQRRRRHARRRLKGSAALIVACRC